MTEDELRLHAAEDRALMWKMAAIGGWIFGGGVVALWIVSGSGL